MTETFNSLRWMVWHDDFNKKSIELFNIFSHYSFNKEIEKLLSEHTNKEEFSAKVKNALMYYFWCKAEYECYISSEFHFASRKVDIYEQVMANFEPFVDYLWQRKNDCEMFYGGFEED